MTANLESTELAFADVNDNLRKLRDFMMAMNENISALIERKDSGLYASRAETDMAIQKLDRRVSNLMDLQLRAAFNESTPMASNVSSRPSSKARANGKHY